MIEASPAAGTSAATSLWNLVRYLSLYRFWQAKIRTALSVGGIVLGVATLVAVAAMNDSILGAFQKSVDEVSGKTELEVSGDEAGFSEDVYLEVQKVPGIKAHTPVLEATGIYTAKDGKTKERVFVMGIDTLADQSFRSYEFEDGSVDMTDPIEFLNATDSIILTVELARKYGIAMEDRITLVTSGGAKEFVVRGLLKPTGPAKTFGGSVALMDVYAAQIAFERERKLDRVDMIAESPEQIDALVERLKQVVPSNLEVRRPYQRSGYVNKLLRSFKNGLFVGSLVALLTGVFLIYNTIAIAVVQRRKEIGVLRSIGVPRRRILALFTVEAAMMGVVGSLLGIPFGTFLAKVLLGGMSRSVSDIYLRVDAQEVVLSPNVAVLGAVLGILTTLVAAIYPALEASRITVLETLRSTSFDVASAARIGRTLWTGVALLAVAGVFSLLPAIDNFPFWGYLSILAVLLGFSFLTPAFLLACRALLRPPLRAVSGIIGTLAADNLVKALGRSSITVAALMVGLTMMVSVSSFLFSVKQSMKDWIDSSVNANLVITASSRMVGPSATPMSSELGGKLRAYPGVQDVTYFRMFNVKYGDGLAMLATINMEVWLRHNTLIEIEGTVKEGLPGVVAGTGLFVSDNFARLYKVKRHQTIELPTPSGTRSFRVEAVVRDFTSDSGVILADRKVLQELWKESLVDTFGVYLPPGVDEEALRQKIASELGTAHDLHVLTNKEFRQDIDRIVESSFRIADALMVLALIISLLGIINTLLAQVIDRTRVLGVLRAIGSERRQIRSLVVMEAGMLGFAGNLVGAVSGLVISLLLIYVVNAQNTGWVIDFHFPLATVAKAFFTALLVALLAGYYPAWHASRLDIVRALERE